MRYPFILCLSVLFLISGCSAIQTAVEFSDLELMGSTQRPVFLRNEETKKLFVLLDCPIKEWVSLNDKLVQGYANKGYTIANSREEADLIMVMLVRNDNDVQKHSARAVQGRDATASGSAVASGAVGYVVSAGDPATALLSGVGGLVVGGLADITINSWVYMGILEVKGDILVVEAKDSKIPSWWKEPNEILNETSTAISVRAKQSGLKWEESASQIETKFYQQAMSILPDAKGMVK